MNAYERATAELARFYSPRHCYAIEERGYDTPGAVRTVVWRFASVAALRVWYQAGVKAQWVYSDDYRVRAARRRGQWTPAKDGLGEYAAKEGER